MAEHRQDGQPTDPNDSYTPAGFARETPTLDAAQVEDIVERQVRADMEEAKRFNIANIGVNLDGYERALRDAYTNRLTGVGDPGKDKTFGGRGISGPEFRVQYMSSWEAMDRWRGSDLGGAIVERIPNEMTRRGWTLTVQPEEGEFDEHDPANIEDSGMLTKLLRRTLIKLGVATKDDFVRAALAARARRGDDFPAPASADPPHVPEPLPHLEQDGTSIVEALEAQQRRLQLRDRIREALCYKRAFGGGAILLGVDDGGMPLTSPLDMEKVKAINHLTTFRGGWDGELVAWRYYRDPRHPKFGQPEVYMLRNIGVPYGAGPAPGESASVLEKTIPNAPFSSTIFWVHESRLLLFMGQPVSRWAQVQMRGWADSIFTRVDRVLSQFDQTWSGISILMQEYSLPVLSMEGLSKLLAMKSEKGLEVVIARAKAQQLAMSIAQSRLIDTKEKLERLSVPMSGTAEVLNQFWLRLSAAAGMPVSMITGQVQGGIGDASKGDMVFFYDQLAGQQEDEVLPVVDRVTRIQFLAKSTSPTGGKIPKRWGVKINPLMQMSDAEQAEYELKIATKDKLYVDMGAVTPEEVGGTRFGGPKFNPGPIVLDMDARRRMAAAATAPAPQVDPAQLQGARPSPRPQLQQGGPPPEPNAHDLPQITDAADLFTRNGRTRVRTRVSIVVGLNAKGEALMLRRRESGKLVFPGGHEEPGEDSISCAYRELWEEARVRPTQIEKVGTKTVSEGLAHVLITVYRAIIGGGQVPDVSQDPDKEADAFEWVPLDGDGNLPDEAKARLHHDPDAVGPVLRRRK